MNRYSKPKSEIWTGRKSNQGLYLHEKVAIVDIAKVSRSIEKSFTILGYCCDEGVKRNQGRPGAVNGPDAIRQQLAKMSNHLGDSTRFIDVGSVLCPDGNMEASQQLLSEQVTTLLNQNTFPIVLGGGHDLAYGHYQGIINHIPDNKTLGIINFDAHYDLRSNENGNNSGTPFYQIAKENNSKNRSFHYLCLGIRADANDTHLFRTASNFGVETIMRSDFNHEKWPAIKNRLAGFLKKVDVVYVTIDLDGFSSAYAPGVSAASPMGFDPEIVLRCLLEIINSDKLISLDLAEMNPSYDRDGQTANWGPPWSILCYTIKNRKISPTNFGSTCHHQYPKLLGSTSKV